jgi:hypothetical protein
MILNNKLNITHQVEFATTAADDKRLKQGTQVFGKDYFGELLDRVRSILSCESLSKNFWVTKPKNA